jgi:hypothetical protein
MSEQPKELGQRTKAELEELFGNMCAGWEHGVVVTQERFGNGDTRFTERSMTQMELAARYVAAEIGANIFEIAGRAAFAPIITFSQIQVHLGPVFDDLTAEIADLRAKLSQAEKDLALSKPLYSRRKLEEENAQLRHQVECGRASGEFVQWALENGPFDGCELDGSDVEAKAEALGLIAPDKERPDWWVYTDKLRRTLKLPSTDGTGAA